MKKIVTAILLFSLTAVSAIFAADANIVNVDRTQVPSFVGYVPNEIVVKFDRSILENTDKLQYSQGTTGISGVDQLGARYNIVSILRQFPGAESRNFRGRVIDLSGWHILTFAGEVDLDDLVREYKLIPGILDAQPIGVHAVTAVPNDTSFASQWHLNQSNDSDMDAPEAWDIETGWEEITVAVLDTGVRYYHRDLGGANAQVNDLLSVAGNMWVNTAERDGDPGVDDDGNGFYDDILGWDFVDDVDPDPHPLWPGEDGDVPDNNPSDFNGHGTHCAGNISAISNNGYHVASPAGGYGSGSLESAANGVKVMALRIGYSADWFGLGESEIGLVRMDWAAQAFYYAADMGAKIATCSWGSSDSGGLGAAIDYFLAQGGLIFKSAGNSNNEIADYMAGRSDVISVAATDENDRIADFSSYGTWVDISAPGVNILSLYHDHYDVGADAAARLSGTSMATPLTASVAALIWSQTPSLSAAEVEQRLYDGADPIDGLNPGFAGKLGAGRVNALNSLNTGNNSSSIAVIGTASGFSGSNGSSLSWAHAIGSGDNRLLVVGVEAEGNGSAPANLDISSVIYNGVPMEAVSNSTATVGTSFLQRTALFYLLESDLPSAGTYPVVVTFAGSLPERSGGSISLANVAQQPAEAVTTNTNTGSNTISTAVTTLSDGALVVDVVGSGNSGDFGTTGSNMSERFDVSTDSASAAGSTRAVAGAGAVTMSWQHSGANRLAHSVAVFAPIEASAPDLDSPIPDPMMWETLPQAMGSFSIKMTAVTAIDPSGVEYYFECTDGGGHDSGWQDSPIYTDTGLDPDTQYTYRVKASDKSANMNETGWSSPESATTEQAPPDNDPPVPDPMTWSVAPYATGSTSIAMTASAATDSSGVEYLFECLSVGCHDSSWQDSPNYTDTGLAPDTPYTYQVKARDKSINQNETGWSTQESATTLLESVDIEFDAAASGFSGTSGSSLSWSHGISSGSNRLLVVGVGAEVGGSASANLDISSVTYNGVPMQAVSNSTVTVGTSYLQRTALFYLLESDLPAAGTYAVVVTFAGSLAERSGGSISLANVAQQPAEAVSTNTSTGSDTISTGVATLSDGAWVVDAIGCGNSGAFTATGSNMSERYDVTTDSASAAGSTRPVAVAGAVTMSWQHSGANRLAHSVAVFAPADASPPDLDPPTPDPSMWETPPQASGPSSIVMTAVTATDPSGVEYYFECTDGGGHDSGWQDSPIYTDTGLDPDTQYTYRVKTSDKSANMNETGWSSPESATTEQAPPDNDPPVPDPMTWSAAPYATGSTSIAMTASAATDPSGFEYLFECLSVGCHDSSWQDSPSYTDTGLAPDTPYTYQVKARDKSINQNETGWSTQESATTLLESVDIEFDAAASGFSGTSGSSLSWSHGIGSGSNRLLVVGVGAEVGGSASANLDISSATYNGVPMQAVSNSTATVGTSYLQRTALFYLLESDLPSAGSYAVVVTFAGSLAERSGGSISLANVAQQPAEAVSTNTSTGSDTISTGVATLSDGAWVVDAVGCGNSGAFTATGSNMSERYDVTTDSASAAGSTRPVAVAGAVTMSWQHSGANRLAHSVAVFAPAEPPPP